MPTCECQNNGMADGCDCRCHNVIIDAWADYMTAEESTARIEAARQCRPPVRFDFLTSIPVTPRPPFVAAATPDERKARWEAAAELVRGERARRARRAREAKVNRFIDWLVSKA